MPELNLNTKSGYKHMFSDNHEMYVLMRIMTRKSSEPENTRKNQKQLQWILLLAAVQLTNTCNPAASVGDVICVQD